MSRPRSVRARVRRRLASIGTKLVALTAVVIAATIALLVWQWTQATRALVYSAKEFDVRGTATTINHTIMNEIDDANWTQVRNNIHLVMRDDPNIAYIVIHADRFHQRIVAAVPTELTDRYIPDIVPLWVTRAALAVPVTATFEAPLLRDLELLERGGDRPTVRVHRGEPILEAASPITNLSGDKIGNVRVGMSLTVVDHAVAAAVRRALAFGAIALVLALIGAFVVARRLARPIERLAADAAQIASGYLSHRATVDRRDELGALARAFNDMAADLEASFGKLRRTSRAFEQFVPRKFLAVIAPAGIENIVVGTGAHRRLSVLFSDLRGFTSLSEGMAPMAVFHLLNDYLARMGGVVDAHGGFVDKYIGDAIMALFDDEHSDGVVRAVVGMRAALCAFNAERAARGLPLIEAGIGVHGGDVVMGTIGFPSKIESTVIGDAVNVASRVESMTKDHKVYVLITGEVVARLSDASAFALRPVAMGVMVRGRDEPIDLYTVDEPPPRPLGLVTS
ncbi:MAG TPA: adenylate/guanylate cyclase domain-containing protein [Kofleriaceae bacterium]|nr:adenylate/guanylate cyclase domain-containing protein [Kofleriaceae bacterium]